MFCAGLKGRQQATVFFGAFFLPQAFLATCLRSALTASSLRSSFSMPLIALLTQVRKAAGDLASSQEHTPGVRWSWPRISPARVGRGVDVEVHAAAEERRLLLAGQGSAPGAEMVPAVDEPTGSLGVKSMTTGPDTPGAP